jgi:hypothetical protein
MDLILWLLISMAASFLLAAIYWALGPMPATWRGSRRALVLVRACPVPLGFLAGAGLSAAMSGNPVGLLAVAVAAAALVGSVAANRRFDSALRRSGVLGWLGVPARGSG